MSGQLFNQMAGTNIRAVSFLGAQVIPAMALGQVPGAATPSSPRAPPG